MASKEAKALEKLVLGDREAEEVIAKLRAGKRRIKKNWITGNLAVDKHGHAVKSTSERAVGWCALGAVDSTEDKLNAAGRALTVSLDAQVLVDGDNVAGFNDDVAGSASDIVELFDKAIEYVKKHGVPDGRDVVRARKRAAKEIEKAEEEMAL